MRMRTGDKPELIHQLLKLVPKCVVSTTLDTGLQFIVDRRALLHKFLWPVQSSYADICAMYVRHARLLFRCALVVFEGCHGPTTKDEAHHRRTGSDIADSVSVLAEMRLSMSKKAFLANTSNNQFLINLIAYDMIKADISVVHAEGDADYRICMLAQLLSQKIHASVFITTGHPADRRSCHVGYIWVNLITKPQCRMRDSVPNEGSVFFTICFSRKASANE